MKLFDILTTASSNTFRSKLRTTLTILAIFIGAFTLTLTNGLGYGISSYLDEQVASFGASDLLVIQPAGNNTAGLPGDEPKKFDPDKKTASIESEGNRTITVMTTTDLNKIKSVEGLTSVEIYQGASIDYVAGKSTDRYLGSVDRFFTGGNFPLDGGVYPDNDAPSRQVLLPSAYIQLLGYGSAAAAIGQDIRFGVSDGLGKRSEVTAKISGVQQKNLVGGNTLYSNNALLSELRRIQITGLPPAATTSFQAVTGRFDAAAGADNIAAIKERLKKLGYEGVTVEDQIGIFKSVIGGLVAILSGFAVIALLAASFGIINTLLMSVQERTKEIGLMKAMGMGARKIYLLFSFEAMMLGFWGSLLGTLGGVGAGQLINGLAEKTFIKDLEGLQLLAFDSGGILSIVGIVMAIAFLAGTLPAIRAARQNPIDSLRYE